MPNQFPRISEDKLATLAKLTGGLALLVLGAVYVSGISTGHPLLAAAITSTQTFGNTTLSITSDSSALSTGGSANIKWSATSVVDTSPTPIGCFGNGTTCASSTVQLQQLNQITSASVGMQTFSDSIGTFAVAGTSASVYIFQWMSSCSGGGGFGSGLVCGIGQTISGTTIGAVEGFTIGSTPYIVVGDASTNGLKTYEWTTASGCSLNGSGFGDGSTCSGIYQQLPIMGIKALRFFTSGSNYYLAVANATTLQVFVWTTASGCPAGGWGNGTACGSTPVYSLSLSGIKELKTFTAGSVPYIVVADSSTTGVKIYKWTVATGCTNGGLGNGTACGTGQSITASGVDTVEPFAVGSAQFLAVGLAASSNALLVYKWDTTSGCTLGGSGFGSATACGSTAYQTLNLGALQHVTSVITGDTFSPYLFVTLTGGGNAWKLFRWTPASGTSCSSYTSGGLGDGTTCGSVVQSVTTAKTPNWAAGVAISGNPYILEMEFTSPASGAFNVYAADRIPCLGGSGAGCGTPLQSVAPNAAVYDTHPFTIGSDTYLAVADQSDPASPIYKWIPSLNCFGKDASNPCGTAFQSIATSSVGDFETVTIGSDTYLAMTQGVNVVTGDSAIYKWMPAGTPASNTTGCFGSGSACGAVFQNILTQSANNYKAITISGSTYLIVTNEWNGGSGSSSFAISSPVYKWMPAGTPASNTTGCFGSGSACGAAYQSIGTYGGIRLESFVGPDAATYLAISNAAGDTVTIYKWITSGATGAPCFGKVGACANSTTGANTYQTISNAGFNTVASHWDIFSIGSDIYFAMPDAGAAQSPGLYKWITSGPAGAPCFGKDTASACGTEYQAIPALMQYGPWGTSSFTYGSDTFLFVGSNYGNTTNPQGVYVWMPAPYSCFGNRSTCGTPYFTLSGYGVGAAPFTINSTLYLATPSTENYSIALVPAPSSPLYAFVPATPSPVCSVTATDPSNNTTTLGSGDVNGTGVSTGALAQAGTYTYTLNCGTFGSVSVPVTVTAPVIVTPTVTITATDPNAAENPIDTGTFTVTRGSAGGGTPKVIFLASGNAWTVPPDWNSSNNTIECVGGGSGGLSGSSSGGGGGGGGAYAEITNVSLTPSGQIPYAVGVGGGVGASGGDTYFNASSLANAVSNGATVSCGAEHGSIGSGSAGGAGGLGAHSVGSVVASGGTGGVGFSGGGGGGGAAGPHGNGGNGGAQSLGSSVGSGGGGADGGALGGTGSNSAPGTGGGNRNNSGGGSVGTGSGGAGSNGGGGGGGNSSSPNGYAGGAGSTESVWTETSDGATAGLGSGGGGAGAGVLGAGGTGGNAGQYGGGGGGGGGYISSGTSGAGGSGKQGIIVITYVPASPVTILLTSSGDGTCGANCWKVPSNWNSANNTIEVIGGGGAGGLNTTGLLSPMNATGGGGGGYSKVSNLSLAPGASISYAVGAGGPSVSASKAAPGVELNGNPGGDTWFNASSLANCVSLGSGSCVAAKGGAGGVSSLNNNNPIAGSAGGLSTGGVGTVKYSGGSSGSTSGSGLQVTGGGGAAGPNGAGNPSGAATVSYAATDGGSGGAGSGGAGGTGVKDSAAVGNPGFSGTEWNTGHGSGGGGGALEGYGDSNIDTIAGSGGNYGGGGGGAVGSISSSNVSVSGAGAPGIIVITYTPAGGPISLSSALTVPFSIATGGSNAVRNTDYTLSGSGVTNPSGATVTIPAGQASTDITVTPIQDFIYERSEPVTMTVQDPGDSSYIVGSPSSATVTITDQQTVTSLPSGSFTSCNGPAGPSCTLGVAPQRVRSGSAVTITWNVTGLVTGANGNNSDSCAITRNPGDSVFPQTWNQSGTAWTNTTGISSTVNQATTFTLTCTAPDGVTTTSVSQKVTLVPSYQEI